MAPRLALLLLPAALLLAGGSSAAPAATAHKAAVAWTLRGTRLNPYARHDYDPKVGTTRMAAPPGWKCVGELAELKGDATTTATLAVLCAKGETIVSTSVQCSYFNAPRPGAPTEGAYWEAGGPHQQLRLTEGTEPWEYAVGCSVSSRHSK